MPVVTSAYKLYNDYIIANSEAELSGQVQVLAGEDRGLYSGAIESCISMDSLLLCTCICIINHYYRILTLILLL